jgi:hypothetical protein
VDEENENEIKEVWQGLPKRWKQAIVLVVAIALCTVIGCIACGTAKAAEPPKQEAGFEVTPLDIDVLQRGDWRGGMGAGWRFSNGLTLAGSFKAGVVTYEEQTYDTHYLQAPDVLAPAAPMNWPHFVTTPEHRETRWSLGLRLTVFVGKHP